MGRIETMQRRRLSCCAIYCLEYVPLRQWPLPIYDIKVILSDATQNSVGNGKQLMKLLLGTQ